MDGYDDGIVRYALPVVRAGDTRDAIDVLMCTGCFSRHQLGLVRQTMMVRGRYRRPC